MTKGIVLLIAVLTFASAIQLRATHNKWLTGTKRILSSDQYSESAWNYCDMKCLYLERYYNNDFVFMTFANQVPVPLDQLATTYSSYRQRNAKRKKPNFGACYILYAGPTGKSYALWNTVAGNNVWYNTYCGNDVEDYYQFTAGVNQKYRLAGIQGEGRNVEIAY